MENQKYKELYEGDEDLDNDLQSEDIDFIEYDISASPNDFNIKTLFDFIESGIVKIPGFQRNYVWDIKRASKLIESIIIGIPIPQIFLFEEERNKFIVIDGQQRYMTIYYFIKKRFPRLDKRFELRQIFDQQGAIPENILEDNNYFVDFNLQLANTKAQISHRKNRINELNYKTLDEIDKVTFELRTIRNIIIKQNTPNDGNSAVFEIFNRLNSGGINLKPQEIRTSLFHSKFYDKLYSINIEPYWRKLTPQEQPDIHMKDIEILLRGFAMLIMDGEKQYTPSMKEFLNSFSYNAKKIPQDDIVYFGNLFRTFAEYCINIDNKMFYNRGKFNISVFESIFYAICKDAYLGKNLNIRKVSLKSIEDLKNNPDFLKSTQYNTASTTNVKNRLSLAYSKLI